MTQTTMTQTMDFEVISEADILHKVGTRGVVIAKVQRCRLGDMIADVRTWVQWETGAIHHIDHVPAK